MTDVVTVLKNTGLGAGGSSNIANVRDGSVVKLILRTPDTGVFVGGDGLNYELGLGGSGNPTSAGYELTPNKEYDFTLYPHVMQGATSDTYTMFIYNSNASGSVSYEALLFTRKGS